MAQTENASTEIVNKMLKVDDRGWNIALFEDATKISNYLCVHCSAVCCDAVELGCDHDEEDEIFIYCSMCLSELIKDNGNKCMISGHENPPLDPARSIRRKILKAVVVCPYSGIFKTRNNLNKNNNGQVTDTLYGNRYDEKEGLQQIVPAPDNDEKSEQTCEWKGILSELRSKHINECVQRHDPTFALNITIQKIQKENILLKEQIINLENAVNISVGFKEQELNNMNDEIKKLKQIIKDKEAKINEQSLMIKIYVKSNKEISLRLKNDNENLINEINKLKRKDTKKNNKMNELKGIIKNKERVINKKNMEIEEQTLTIKDFIQSNDEKNKLIKILKQQSKNNQQKPVKVGNNEALSKSKIFEHQKYLRNVSKEMDDKLNALNEMGYKNRTFNLVLLKQENGDMEKVIHNLKQFYEHY